MIRIGIDVGSTTVKMVAFRSNKMIFSDYCRHSARVREVLVEMLEKIYKEIGNEKVNLAIAGSAGLGIAEATNLPFIQEVMAATSAIKNSGQKIDCAIELGGEDAKIIFFGEHLEQRMNGTCAGGTGAFIDQMATLLGIDVLELNELAKKHQQVYAIASRCGVFAKSDIQPLLNQGASREDISASVLQAIVNQTIAGLAQGRKIVGNIAFLGGPLFFLSELRQAFINTLDLKPEQIFFPDNAHLFVAVGTAYESIGFSAIPLQEVIEKIKNIQAVKKEHPDLLPLFSSEEDYKKFKERGVNNQNLQFQDLEKYQGKAYLGIDSGSTTTKIIMIGEDSQILYQFYNSNLGNPLILIHEKLLELLTICEKNKIEIVASAITGYGEELMKKAFHIDFGYVETVAHFRAAKHFDPQVTFIIDIGGQDMKCMRIKNNAIDSIMLNEACSSGCGSFIETFAKALGYSASDFANLGLFAKHPANLGSRCTVFMNSSVKQAQKEGATVEDVAAGIAISVVKNALYKVLRVKDKKELGEHVVVQGGTFYNDAVLRALEQELDLEVIRPVISGMMGAFGAALLAKENALKGERLLSLQALKLFAVTQKNINCQMCTNKCLITINTFEDGRRFVTGNKCEKGIGGKEVNILPNAFKANYEMLMALKSVEGKRGKIGLPMVLNFFDNYPFWHAFFTHLNFEVVTTGKSSKDTYFKGQQTIPSDTVCYPAKLVHGHILQLIDKGIKNIFYPIIVYNIKEKKYVDNHYNCPVVAYYPELIAGNVDRISEVNYITPYLQLRSPNFNKAILQALNKYYPDITYKEIKAAEKAAWQSYKQFQADIRFQASMAIDYAVEHDLPIVILSGRPYHLDPGVNHGIPELLSSLGVVVVAENQISHLANAGKRKVLNQWTYHSRLYDAAQFAAVHKNFSLVQLVSFGCGLDAVTTDETRSILENNGALYTQIKIDEITNLGAAKIRLRSLLAALEAQKAQEERVEKKSEKELVGIK